MGGRSIIPIIERRFGKSIEEIVRELASKGDLKLIMDI